MTTRYVEMKVSNSRSKPGKLSLIGVNDFRSELGLVGFKAGDDVVVITKGDFDRLSDAWYRLKGLDK